MINGSNFVEINIEFIEINKSLNLKANIITSPDQSRLMNKKRQSCSFPIPS
jgi:hypothetical protein